MEPPPRTPAAGAIVLVPLQVESTPAVVAARIRAGIFARRFAPDAQLNEVELARELQVSRGPIREAFARLSSEGLLRRERNRGVFVVVLDQQSIADIYYVRAIVETAAALRIAAALRTREMPREVALSELETILRDVEDARDGEWSELVALDLEFHRCLVRLAGSERLARAFEPLYAESRLCLAHLESHYPDRSALIEEHRGILDAIRAGDVEQIEQLVGAHMSESAAKLTAREEGSSA